MKEDYDVYDKISAEVGRDLTRRERDIVLAFLNAFEELDRDNMSEDDLKRWAFQWLNDNSPAMNPEADPVDCIMRQMGYE